MATEAHHTNSMSKMIVAAVLVALLAFAAGAYYWLRQPPVIVRGKSSEAASEPIPAPRTETAAAAAPRAPAEPATPPLAPADVSSPLHAGEVLEFAADVAKTRRDLSKRSD